MLHYDLRGHGGSGAPEGAYSFEQLSADLTGLLDITAQLGAIRAPTLVIAGARLEIIAAASHLSCLEQPAEFNRLVAAFLGA